MNVLRKMKTYVHIFYGRYIPIRNVAIEFCWFIKHGLEGNEIKINISIDRKIKNIKHECFTKKWKLTFVFFTEETSQSETSPLNFIASLNTH